jgi:hypothetical protein
MCKNVVVGLIMVCVLALGYANAAVVFYDGFETQPLGSGFANSGSATSPVGLGWSNDWPKDPDKGELVITNAVAEGTQSLQVNRNWPDGGQYPTLFGLSSEGAVDIGYQLKYKWDFMIQDSATAGPQIFVLLGGPASGGWLVENGGNGVVPVGHLAVQNNGAWVDTGVLVTPQTWATFEMDILVQAAGTTQRKGTFDAFITMNGVKTQVASSYALTRQAIWDDIARFHIYGNPAVSSFNLDNVSIESIPEPATITLLGIGLMALLRKRS